MTELACLTDDEVSEYVAGNLPPARRSRVEEHIAACASCGELTALVAGGSLRRSGHGEPAAAPLTPGARVGRYEIRALLGAGAMGTVYRALDPALDRLVALKLIRAELAGPGLEARLLREAKTMARLSHPQIIAVFDAGRDGDRLFIAMELVEGGTLREWLAERRRTWREVLSVCLRAGRGLEAAHRAGVVHRDFKPDNVLVGRGGEVRVTDFGLARVTGPEEEKKGPELETVAGDLFAAVVDTRTGTFVGTPAYMSPEQWTCKPATAASDVFSYCATVYEALHGVRPFEGNALPEFRKNVLSGAVRRAPPDTAVPAAMRRVLARGLRSRPGERPPSMDELLADLSRAARSRWIVGGGVGLAAVSLAVGLGLARHPAHRARPAGAPRPSIAVLGVFDGAPAPEADGAAGLVLGELLATELGAGERMRVVAGDTTARLRRDFLVGGAASPEATARLARAAGADYVLSGTCASDRGHVAVDVDLRDGKRGERVAAFRTRGDEASLVILAENMAERVREAADVGAASDAEVLAARAVLPQGPEALRAYARGVAELRAGEAPTARDSLARAVALDGSSPLSHGALAVALVKLGATEPARAEVKLAVEGASRLGRADQLSLEALSFELERAWDKAIDTYKALYRFYPDEIDYALRLGGVQARAARYEGAFATVDALRALPRPTSDDPRIDLLEGKIANSTGDFRRNQRVAAVAARKARDLGLRAQLADARADEAWALIQLGDSVNAREAVDEATRLYSELGDRGGRAYALHLRANLFQSDYDFTSALPLGSEAAELVRSVGDTRRTIMFTTDVAGIRGHLGDLARAAVEYEEAVALSRSGHQRGLEESALSNLGWVYAALAQFDRGRAALDEALALGKDLGTHKDYFHLLYLAILELDAGRLDRAKEASEQGTQLAHDGLKREMEVTGLLISAVALHHLGDEPEAVKHVAAADALVQAGVIGKPDLLLTRALLELDAGRASDAAEHASEAEAVLRPLGTDDETANAASLVCRAFAAAKDVANAAAACDRADARAAETQALEVVVRAAIARAELETLRGAPEEAAARLDAAIARAAGAGASLLEIEGRRAALRVLAAQGRGKPGDAARLAREAGRRGFVLIARSLATR